MSIAFSIPFAWTVFREEVKKYTPKAWNYVRDAFRTKRGTDKAAPNTGTDNSGIVDSDSKQPGKPNFPRSASSEQLDVEKTAGLGVTQPPITLQDHAQGLETKAPTKRR